MSGRLSGTCVHTNAESTDQSTTAQEAIEGFSAGSVFDACVDHVGL